MTTNIEISPKDTFYFPKNIIDNLQKTPKEISEILYQFLEKPLISEQRFIQESMHAFEINPIVGYDTIHNNTTTSNLQIISNLLEEYYFTNETNNKTISFTLSETQLSKLNEIEKFKILKKQSKTPSVKYKNGTMDDKLLSIIINRIGMQKKINNKILGEYFK
ncbi:hypothetical protein [Pseudolactococcus insecticola]|uniref:Uncharacterized protein n=1 Tax=Pseudolactococcus insecticola TaxID=2709158 RepID=A0A6A0B7I7_9LACT|nr:hypothetical protein [Lactococcus insecticola]GFH41242.1 hypothetical protein Hs20B_16400 [Lactococcus insecticola]